jgi:hypothetical protein
LKEKKSTMDIYWLPGVGLSADNLWRMRQLYAEYTSPEFLEQAVPEMAANRITDKNPEKLSQAVREMIASSPWGHHLELLKKTKEPAARIYYLRAIAQFGWSRNVLLNQIKAGAYERAKKEKKTHNFELAPFVGLLPRKFIRRSGNMRGFGWPDPHA